MFFNGVQSFQQLNVFMYITFSIKLNWKLQLDEIPVKETAPKSKVLAKHDA